MHMSSNMMLGTESAFLTSSMMTLNETGHEAASSDKNDTLAGKYKAKSLVNDVSGILKAMSYNKDKVSDVDPDNPRDIKIYFLENCSQQDVNSAQIMPIEEIPAQSKLVVKNVTQAADKVMQRISKGDPWAADSMDILKSAAAQYLDFPQNKSFSLPSTKTEFEQLYQALLDANAQLHEATFLLIRIAKSCYKTVTVDRPAITDQDIQE